MEEYFKNLGYIGPIAEYDRNTAYWYKKMPETTRHQVVVRKWQLFDKPNYEVEATFETYDGIWATIKFYGLNEEDLKVNLNKLELRLKQSLVSMGANPHHYRRNGQD